MLETEVMPKEASTLEEIRHQKSRDYHREYNKKYYQENKEKVRGYQRKYRQKNKEKIREYSRKYRNEYYQKNKERIRERENEYRRNRYRSDPEYKEKRLEAARRRHLKDLEDYNRFKIEYGGKCKVCEEDNLEVIDSHHPDGKEEKCRSFIHTKEFRRWVKYGVKPNVVLMCANCHRILENMLAREEINNLQDFLDTMGVRNGVG